MKIAFINIYQGQVDRGAETFVSEVSKRLKKEYKVDVFGGDKLPLKRWRFLWRVFIDPQGFQILWFTLKLLPKLFKERYDIVIPLNGGWQSVLVRLLTLAYGGKVVVSGQSGKGWDDLTNLWVFPNGFVALSQKAKNWAERTNPFVKSAYIPNGVDLKNFKPKGSSLKTRLKKPIILTVGALEEGKRIETVIKRVSDYGKASLLVVGDGPKRENIRYLGRALLQKRFQLEKFTFEDMPKVYRCADAFILVSKPMYSFEIALVEAMASNLPLIANKDEIRKEIVGRAGILVDAEDSTEFIKAIVKLLSNKWGKKPRVQAKNFSWDKITKKYEELFEEVTE